MGTSASIPAICGLSSLRRRCSSWILAFRSGSSFDQVQPEVVGPVGGRVRQVGEEPVEMFDDEHRAVRVVAAVVAADDEGLDGGVRPALIAPALQHPLDLLRRRSGLHRDSVDVVNHDLLPVPNVVIIPNGVNYDARRRRGQGGD